MRQNLHLCIQGLAGLQNQRKLRCQQIDHQSTLHINTTMSSIIVVRCQSTLQATNQCRHLPDNRQWFSQVNHPYISLDNHL